MPANPTPARTDVDDLIEDFVCKQVANRPRAVSDRPEWHNRLVPPPGKPAYPAYGCAAVPTVPGRNRPGNMCQELLLHTARGNWIVCHVRRLRACSWACCTCSGTTRSLFMLIYSAPVAYRLDDVPLRPLRCRSHIPSIPSHYRRNIRGGRGARSSGPPGRSCERVHRRRCICHSRTANLCIRDHQDVRSKAAFCAFCSAAALQR